MNTPNTQMEINFDSNPPSRCFPRQRTRMEQAQWWFARIRQVVNAAGTAQPAPTARPVQERFEIAA